MKQSRDIVILGSGIVAHELFELLQHMGKSLKVTVIDVSSAILIPQIESNSSLFSSSINKTAIRGGGAQLWGSKVTIPTEHNWFSNTNGNKEWRTFGEWVISNTNRLAQTKFLNSVRRGLDMSFRETRRLNPQLEENREKNVFLADHIQLNSEILKFGYSAMKLDKLKELTYEEGKYLVQGTLEGGEELQIDSRQLVLASGPIGNAILSTFFARSRTFPIGNHGGIKVGKVSFDGVVSLGADGYLRDRENFYSFGFFDTEEGLNHSFRFTVDPDRPSSLRSLLQLGSAKARLLGLIDLIYLRYGSAKSCEVTAFVDSGTIGTMILQEDRESIDDFRRNRFQNIHISVDPNRLQRVNARLLSEIQSRLDIAKIRFEPYPTVFIEDMIHYFGTTPMGSQDENGLGINSFAQSSVFPGLFILGASTFAQGSHGHPTLLSVLTAHRAATAMI